MLVPKIRREKPSGNAPGLLQLSNCTAEEVLAAIEPRDKRVLIEFFESEILPKLPDTVKTLTLFHEADKLKNIEGYSANLENFNLHGCSSTLDFVSKIPPFPSSIKLVSIWFNSKTEIRIKRTKIDNDKPGLHCKNPYFVAIEKVIQPTDTSIIIEQFQEPVLPMLPSTVKDLDIRKSLPNTKYNLPSELEKFICMENNFRSLPELPDTLEFLSCAMNPLGRLPELPPNLKDLFCSKCELTELPKFPDSLREISCDNNLLTTFPPFTPNMVVVLAQNNKITRLPKMRRFRIEDAQEGIYLNFDNNPLREPFKTFYEEYRNALSIILHINNIEVEQQEIINFMNTLANKIDAYDAITSGMRGREENIKQRINRVGRIQQTFGQAGPLPTELAAAVASFYSGVGNLGTRSLNQQVATLKQRLPEYQAVGVTQQPVLSEVQKRKQNSNTRMRLKKLLREEKNIKRKSLKGGKRTTRRLRRKN